MLMEIYRDTTGMFTTKECEDDNVIAMEFDDAVVRRFYEEQVNPGGSDEDFDEWVNSYTYGDVDTLYDFAVGQGKKPKV